MASFSQAQYKNFNRLEFLKYLKGISVRKYLSSIHLVNRIRGIVYPLTGNNCAVGATKLNISVN